MIILSFVGGCVMEFSLKRKENLTHSHQGRAIELLGYGASG
jgi:hypothetical protein